MKELDFAHKLHNELDAEYARKLFRATSLSQTKAIQRYTELRRINDGAYFLIIFGTFEKLITDKADAAVRARTGKSPFHLRRAWETLQDGSKLQAHFLNRVRILLDQRLATF